MIKFELSNVEIMKKHQTREKEENIFESFPGKYKTIFNWT
jgi:hypothetical protein